MSSLNLWLYILAKFHGEHLYSEHSLKNVNAVRPLSRVNRDHMDRHDIERPKSGTQNILSFQKCHQAIFQY